MTQIESYAVELVHEGAGHIAQEDSDEEGVFESEGDWQSARKLGLDMASTIEANPESFLAWYREMKLAEAVR